MKCILFLNIINTVCFDTVSTFLTQIVTIFLLISYRELHKNDIIKTKTQTPANKQKYEIFTEILVKLNA